MFRNIFSPGHPNFTLQPGGQALYKPLQRHESTRFANDAAMQTDSHHLRLASVSFREQDIER